MRHSNPYNQLEKNAIMHNILFQIRLVMSKKDLGIEIRMTKKELVSWYCIKLLFISLIHTFDECNLFKHFLSFFIVTPKCSKCNYISSHMFHVITHFKLHIAPTIPQFFFPIHLPLMMHSSPLVLPLPANNNIHTNVRVHKNIMSILLVSRSKLLLNIH